MISLSLQLVDDIPTINGKILNAFRLQLNSIFKRAASGIKRRIGEVCEDLIEGSEEYKSLLSGDLLGELGVPDIHKRMEAILRTIKSSCDVEFTPIVQAGTHLTGGLVIKMVRSDFMDVLGLPEAVYETEKGTQIPWLNWLLTQGVTVIIIGYDVKLNLSPKERARSRTGLGLMEPGTGWRVPPEFSGIIEDNFITRAFVPSEVERLLIKIIEEEIVGRL